MEKEAGSTDQPGFGGCLAPSGPKGSGGSLSKGLWLSLWHPWRQDSLFASKRVSPLTSLQSLPTLSPLSVERRFSVFILFAGKGRYFK